MTILVERPTPAVPQPPWCVYDYKAGDVLVHNGSEKVIPADHGAEDVAVSVHRHDDLNGTSSRVWLASKAATDLDDEWGVSFTPERAAELGRALLDAAATASGTCAAREPTTITMSNGGLSDPDREEDIDGEWDPIGAFRQWLRRKAHAERLAS